MYREKDGFELLPDTLEPRFQIITDHEHGRTSLSVHTLHISDSGMYTCIAHNRYGRDRSIGFVHVESQPGGLGRTGSSLGLRSAGGVGASGFSSELSGLSFAASTNSMSVSSSSHPAAQLRRGVGRGRSLPPTPPLAPSMTALTGRGELPSLAEQRSPSPHNTLLNGYRADTPEKTGFLNVVETVAKVVEVTEGEALTLTCLVNTNIHYIQGLSAPLCDPSICVDACHVIDIATSYPLHKETLANDEPISRSEDMTDQDSPMVPTEANVRILSTQLRSSNEWSIDVKSLSNDSKT
ncbi:unnamed protein product [Protopolystoma xenopodis]|uniref:Ig-like domain-containing protein n=1 Tax=Protopolystoma xenopodis TaxID=117903 RepID=A0A3S5AE59_9PLAT|nr:unnamed protein product [Protopolystoma xenopodis]